MRGKEHGLLWLLPSTVSNLAKKIVYPVVAGEFNLFLFFRPNETVLDVKRLHVLSQD